MTNKLYKKKGRKSKKRTSRSVKRTTKNCKRVTTRSVKMITKGANKRASKFIGGDNGEYFLKNGECLAFGKGCSFTKNFFGNFEDLSMISKICTTKIKYHDHDTKNGIKKLSSAVFLIDWIDKSKMFKTQTVMKKLSYGPYYDNIYYEYRVGKHINTWGERFPTFAETYGLYMCNSSFTPENIQHIFCDTSNEDNPISKMQKINYVGLKLISKINLLDILNEMDKISSNIKKNILDRVGLSEIEIIEIASGKKKLEIEQLLIKEMQIQLLIKEIQVKMSCMRENRLIVMTQYLKGHSLRNHLYERDKRTKKINLRFKFIENELWQILFQIYSTLAMLGKDFTHYDLRIDNVIIYEPIKKKYITYHYKISEEKEISFHCPFMAKIIDFGRSFVSGVSEEIYKDVREEPRCKNFVRVSNRHDSDDDESKETNTPGWNEGYRNLYRSVDLDAWSLTHNITHDLKLLDEIDILTNDNPHILVVKENNRKVEGLPSKVEGLPSYLLNILEILNYNKQNYPRDLNPENRKFAPENILEGYHKDPKEINNIFDVFEALKENIPEFKEYDIKDKMGDLYIDLTTTKDKMRWVSVEDDLHHYNDALEGPENIEDEEELEYHDALEGSD